MSAWIPAETGPTTGSAPEAPDADLIGEEPTAAKGSCFLMTNGRGCGGDSRKEVTRDGGWATTVLRMERGGMVGADATGGGGTRVYMRGRRFSFPLMLLLFMNADFFHVLSAGMPPPLASLGEALSTRENVLVKANVVDTDAGRLDGCRARGAAAPAVTTCASWC
jgi:hypothetical protein